MFQPTPDSIASGDERSIARAISWVENQHPKAAELLENLSGHSKVVGFTGPPGAGKSSLVNSLVLHWSSLGYKTAIVAVDPSSPFNLGSLLGDRLRMPGLFLHENVFIRSVSSRGSLGGLSTAIIEITDVLKHAGFDFIVIETVGVGQSEIEIAGIADTTVVVSVPESGDEVQTLKSGIMEIADIFVVNKSDREGAETFANHLKQLAHTRSRENWETPVVQTVATQSTGIEMLSDAIQRHAHIAKKQFRYQQLLADKIYKIVQREKMKHLPMKEIMAEIQSVLSQNQEPNIYKIAKKYL